MKIKKYVKPETLEEAYELNQKKSARLIGGMMWLRTGRETIATAVDLSGLGLHEIRETEDEFRIGAMVTLRQLELHPGLNDYTRGSMREALRSIVGVQFRNLATVGGSIWGRFGFSDVLTLFLALDTRVNLYKAGEQPLHLFAEREKDSDILTELVVKKRPQRTVYQAFRNTKTDFPVLTCAAALPECETIPGTVTVGARPGRAITLNIPGEALEILRRREPLEQGMSNRTGEALEQIAGDLGAMIPTGSNLRAGAEYRSHLARVLIRRNLERLCAAGEGGASCRS